MNFIDPLGLHLVWIGSCLYDRTDFYVDGEYVESEYEFLGCLSGGGGGGGGGEDQGGGGGGAGGSAGSSDVKSAPSLVTKAISAVCSIVPDATSVSGGVDVGNGFVAGGAQAGWVFNGRSGQATCFFSLVGSAGLIGTDAYVATGVIPNASDNSGVRGGGQSFSAGAGRVGGIASTPGHYQATAGASTNLVTSAVQGSYTFAIDIPYSGYVANWPRAACQAATGQ